MTTNVAFVDTETLGLDADHHPVWEVGLITPNGKEHHWFVTVTPRQVDLAHPKALEIGRFAERYDAERAVHRGLFCRQFVDLLPDGCHLAGAVVSFDEERIRRTCWRHQVRPNWHYHLIDVETLAIGYLAGLDHAGHGVETLTPPWNSDQLTAALGITVDDMDKHTALGDARWARAIFLKVMGS